MLWGRDFPSDEALGDGLTLDAMYTSLAAAPGFAQRDRAVVEPHAGRYAFLGWRMDYSMYFPHVLLNLAETLPDVKILFSLRNPVDATYSVWCRRRERGAEESFESFLGMRADAPEHAEPQHWAQFYEHPKQVPAAVQRSIYATGVLRCLALFPRAQVHVVPFERLTRETAQTMASILEFLGLDPGYRFTRLGEVRSPSHKPEPMSAETRSRLLEFYAPFNAALIERLDWPRDTWTR